MKRYKPRPVSVPTSRGRSFPKGASYTVKVENISKGSNEAGLEKKLIHYQQHISNIRIVPCPDYPANFAYVNCTDFETADSIVTCIDRKVLLDSNLLTAKLKGGGSRETQPRHVPANVPGRNMCTVKLLINGSTHITDADLAEHFSEFGALLSTRILLGSPNYAYVNFYDPISAQEARKVSHSVCGVTLRTVPGSYDPSFRAKSAVATVPGSYDPSFRSKSAVTTVPGSYDPSSRSKSADPGSYDPSLRSNSAVPAAMPASAEIVRNEFPCDPIAGHYVKEAVDGYVKEMSLQGKVTAQEKKIFLFARESVAVQIREFVLSSIRDHEHEIGSNENVMECFYLPLLSDQSVQEQLKKLQVPFELKVLHAGSYLPLEKLVQVYSGCDDKTVKADVLRPFLQSAKTGSTEYSWYWDEGAILRPYDASISQKLERAFVSKLTITESIGRHRYEVDTSRMKQTNMETRKVRKIERKAARKIKKWNISLKIRAHLDHLGEIEEEILGMLEKRVETIKVSVPYVEDDSNLVEYLLELARESFVSAEKVDDCGSVLVLRGMLSVVKDAEVRLKADMLTRKLEAVKVQAKFEGVRKPDHWGPQKDDCTLKEVRQGTEEWTTIEKHMAEPGFRIRLLRVERIQNLWLWDVYSQSHKRMSNKNSGKVNERALFHGTRNVPPVKIYKSEQGFDNRLSSRGMWGEGAYFAVRAAYSDRYAYTTPGGHKQMFLAKVITGITYKCPPDNSLKAPPKKSDHPSALHSSGSKFEDERYDSVSGNTNGSDIYVIYEHGGKVYPAYLITYKTHGLV